MRVIKKIEDYVSKKNPYEYEKYTIIKSDFSISDIKRKARGLKCLVKCLISLKVYNNINVHYTESQEYPRLNSKDYAAALLKYDVISFDVFDTLILRNVLESEDIYILVGIKLGVNGFKKIRQSAEKEARKRLSIDSSDDVKLSDIYAIINEWYGIDVSNGINAEMEVEKAVCVANPYWKPVFDELIEKNKTVVITTDMYMSNEEIKELLNCNGYNNVGNIYVSCELNKSKRNGKIFEFIKDEVGIDKKMIHIGDNPISDYKIPRSKGWDSIYYKNVHTVGKKYRKLSKGIIARTISEGIINVSLHNGSNSFSALEEFGFNYYGRLYVGYCKWLDKLAMEKNIDKFLFVSRDGYLLKKIYSCFFNTIANEYVYASRYALSQICVFEDMEMFIRQNLEPKAVKAAYTIRCVFSDLGLENIFSILEDENISVDMVLDRKNIDFIRTILYKHKNEVVNVFADNCKAAERYFLNIIKGCNAICVVDIGWFGTCTRGITCFLKKHMKWDGNVYGAQIGIECSEDNMELYGSERLCSYIFSPDYCSNMYEKHDFEIGNVVNEIIFSAPEPSLRRYMLDDKGNAMLEFMDEPDNNADIVKEVQKGVYKYAEKYCDIEKKLDIQLPIFPDAAYEPILNVCKNRKYINSLLGKYVVQRCAEPNNNGIYVKNV